MIPIYKSDTAWLLYIRWCCTMYPLFVQSDTAWLLYIRWCNTTAWFLFIMNSTKRALWPSVCTFWHCMILVHKAVSNLVPPVFSVWHYFPYVSTCQAMVQKEIYTRLIMGYAAYGFPLWGSINGTIQKSLQPFLYHHELFSTSHIMFLASCR